MNYICSLGTHVLHLVQTLYKAVESITLSRIVKCVDSFGWSYEGLVGF